MSNIENPNPLKIDFPEQITIEIEGKNKEISGLRLLLVLDGLVLVSLLVNQQWYSFMTCTSTNIALVPITILALRHTISQRNEFKKLSKSS